MENGQKAISDLFESRRIFNMMSIQLLGSEKPVRIVHFQDDKTCFLIATSSSTLLNPNTLN
jgi:hypothetical protein